MGLLMLVLAGCHGESRDDDPTARTTATATTEASGSGHSEPADEPPSAPEGPDADAVAARWWPALAASASASAGIAADRLWPDGWQVLAVLYGTSRYPHGALVRGESGSHPMGWWFWVLRQGDVVVLFDVGFEDADKAEGRGIDDYLSPLAMLAGIGIEAQDVDHVVLSHGHWDHAGDVGRFPDARVWVRARELAWMRDRVGDGGKRSHAGLRRPDLEAIESVEADGRLKVIEDGSATLLPGIEARGDGKHTPGAQWLVVGSGERTVVLASDNAYLYQNIREPVAIGTSVSASGNLDAIEEMRETASALDLIVPGHDPEVQANFPPLDPAQPRVVVVADPSSEPPSPTDPDPEIP